MLWVAAIVLLDDSRTPVLRWLLRNAWIAKIEGPNLHARARDFRYRFFETVATETGATRIVTGHTLDDRVETTLARLVHGAGTSGLAGIPPVEGKRVRPLLGSRRNETREYCIECGLDFYEDPANEDDRFERSAIRSRVVPAIEERWGDGAIRSIAQSSERLREDAAALSQLAERLYGIAPEAVEDLAGGLSELLPKRGDPVRIELGTDGQKIIRLERVVLTGCVLTGSESGS